MRTGRADAWRIGVLLCLVAGAALAWTWRLTQHSSPDSLEAFLVHHGIAGAVVAVQPIAEAPRVRVIGQAVRGARPLTTSTRFPIASLSKPITASAVRTLVRLGELELDDVVFDVLPEESTWLDRRYEQITIRHLLQHVSGLDQTRGDPLFAGAAVTGCDNAIRATLSRPLENLPGSTMRYSNVGYCLLGRAIASATGKEYEDATRELLDLPPTMTLGPPADAAEGIAAPHDASWTGLGAAGGWFSDALGLLGVLSWDARDAAIPSPVTDQTRDWYYGLGWRVWPRGDHYALSHFGNLPGTFSMIRACPDGRAALILLNGTPTKAHEATAQLFSLLGDELRGNAPATLEDPCLR